MDVQFFTELELATDVFEHALDVFMFAARFKDALTFPQISPFENVDRHAAHTPVIHGGAGGLVKIDGVGSGQGPTVIVDLEDFTRGCDLKYSADRPARPIGGSAVDRVEAQLGAESVARSIFSMIALGVRVSGGANFLYVPTGQGTFVIGQGTPRAADQREEGDATKKTMHHCLKIRKRDTSGHEKSIRSGALLPDRDGRQRMPG